MLTPYINYDAFVKTQKLTLVPYYLLKYRLCLIFTHFPSDVLFCSRTMSRVPWCIYLVVTASVSSILLTVSQPFLRRRQWHPTPVFLPGKSHGWRSLVGYSPRGCKESDMTERLHFHFHFVYLYERDWKEIKSNIFSSSIVQLNCSARYMCHFKLSNSPIKK